MPRPISPPSRWHRVRRAIEFILRQQEPYPARVTNRHWDVVLTNEALNRLFGKMRGGPPTHMNVMRQVFDPADMRPFVANWEEVAGDLIRHLHNDVAAAPTDTKARALLEAHGGDGAAIPFDILHIRRLTRRHD